MNKNNILTTPTVEQQEYEIIFLLSDYFFLAEKQINNGSVISNMVHFWKNRYKTEYTIRPGIRDVSAEEKKIYIIEIAEKMKNCINIVKRYIVNYFVRNAANEF